MCNRSFAVSSVWVPDLRNGHYAPALCLLIFLVCSAFVPVLAQAPTEVRRTELTITGTVRDKESKRALENVSVTLTGSSIGTVTNADGLFSLKIPHCDSTPQLECSHLGYLNTRLTPSVPTDANQLNLTVWMTPTVKQLDEVVVYGGNAAKLSFIISARSGDITRALLEMDMGVTLLSGTGAYKNLPTRVVMCAFSRGYIIPVKKLVQRIDPDAFVIVCDTHEILGEGFGTYDPTGL